MKNTMRLTFTDYKNVRFSSDIIALYFNRLLLQVAFNIVGIFYVIFFFIAFDQSVAAAIAIYAAIHFMQGAMTPLAARLLSVVGLKHLMIAAIPFAFLATFALFFWDAHPFFALAAYIVFLTAYKALYWTPYHVDFAKFTDRRTRGRQISILRNVSYVVLIASPLAGGAIIVFFGYDSLFLLSAALFLLALIPLFFIKKTSETFSFGYFETFKKLLQKKHRSLLLAYAGDGAQTAVTAVVWPIFIFLLLDGKFLAVGAISSLTILALIALRFVIGEVVDSWSKQKVLTIGSLIYTAGWIIKTFVETATQIFIVDTFHRAGGVISKTSFDVTTYDQAVDNGHYIDEFTVLREVAHNFGRVAMFILVAALIGLFSIKAAFIMAALATLLMIALNKHISVT